MHGLIVIVGIMSPFTVKVVGTMPLGEIAFLLLLPILLAVRWRRAFGGHHNIVLALIGLWLLGQIVTDLYRKTPAVDWMRGQATIEFFLVDFICLAILTRQSSFRKMEFIVAFSLGTILTFRYQPTDLMQAYPWKFGFAEPVTVLLLVLASFFFRYRLYPVVFLIFGLLVFLNLIFNYRSEVLFLFVAVVLTLPLVPERIGRLRLLPGRHSFARVFVLAGLAALGGGLSILAIGLVTSHGYAGEHAQQKNEKQFQSNQGFLLTGRPEILVSSRAVLDSPILGHGSWAKDPKYAEMLNDLEIRNGLTTVDIDYVLEESNGLIPAHSHLMSAWVFAGIAGAPIWIFMFWITLRALSQLSLKSPPLSPLYGWMFTSFLWAILFSPFGGSVRITEAVTVNIVIDLLSQIDMPSSVKPIFRPATWKRNVYRRRMLQNVS